VPRIPQRAHAEKMSGSAPVSGTSLLNAWQCRCGKHLLNPHADYHTQHWVANWHFDALYTSSLTDAFLRATFIRSRRLETRYRISDSNVVPLIFLILSINGIIATIDYSPQFLSYIYLILGAPRRRITVIRRIDIQEIDVEIKINLER